MRLFGLNYICGPYSVYRIALVIVVFYKVNLFKLMSTMLYVFLFSDDVNN